MKKKLLILLLAILWFKASPIDVAWYDNNWQYRKQITIDHTDVAGSSNLTNFQVLVSLTTDTDLASDAQADGDDILFTSSDEATKLDHEIEYFNESTGEFAAWVEVPSLDFDDDTVIYIYYGYASASNQQNMEGTWSSSYRVVQHLQESGNSTVDEFVDSTSNNNDGEGGSTMGTCCVPDQTTSGKISRANDFEADNDDIISIPSDNSQGFSDSFTMSLWVKPETLPNPTIYNSMIAKPGAEAGVYWFELNGNETNCGFFDGGYQDHSTTTANLSTGNWYHLVCVFDNSGNTVKIYKNGSQSISQAETNTPEVGSGLDLFIGSNGNSSQMVDGVIDEVRIISGTLSADWVSTEYANQNSPSTFYTLGSEQNNATAAFTQSAYRFFAPSNSTDVGSALAAQDAPALIGAAGSAFRLRQLIHISDATLGISGKSFKLQYAPKSGTCDTSFTGETYADVTTSTPIAYYNNTTPTDGSALTNNANDPSHSGHTLVNQTYEEANSFTNSQSTISAGADGKWDFSLIDYSGEGGKSYCLRVIEAGGPELSSYTTIPEIMIPTSLTFSISAVGASSVYNGITTSVASTANTLPLGDITVNTPKYIAHQLFASSNSASGYTVNMNFLLSSIMQGIDPADLIDPFTGNSAAWTTPATWVSPTGTTPNTNTGWIGANTTDTRVTGWASASQKFGPVSTNAYPVMFSSTPDTGTTAHVTYAFEVNILQPTDQYSGQIMYTITPTY